MGCFIFFSSSFFSLLGKRGQADLGAALPKEQVPLRSPSAGKKEEQTQLLSTLPLLWAFGKQKEAGSYQAAILHGLGAAKLSTSDIKNTEIIPNEWCPPLEPPVLASQVCGEPG